MSSCKISVRIIVHGGELFFWKGEEIVQKKYMKLAIILIAFLLAGTIYCLSTSDKEAAEWESMRETEQSAEETKETIMQTEKMIYVHICGEVNQPGVYSVPEGFRVYELLEMAGGATSQGAPDAMNLADIIKDGERIVIPSMEEAASMAVSESGESTGLVNLNTASINQLMTLPGIGESKAKDIVRYREENGGFQSIEDIMKISGIKEAVFQKIRSLITV